MSPINRHKYKYFHSTVQRAKDRRQKFNFCRLPFDVRPRNVKLNLSIDVSLSPEQSGDNGDCMLAVEHEVKQIQPIFPQGLALIKG